MTHYDTPAHRDIKICDQQVIGSSPIAGSILCAGPASADPREAAILKTLTPGNYTAIVRGKNNTSGVGLIEVFNVQ